MIAPAGRKRRSTARQDLSHLAKKKPFEWLTATLVRVSATGLYVELVELGERVTGLAGP